MSWYMLPAAIAFSVKLWFLLTLKSRSWAGKRWAGLVAIFCMHNLSEILVFNSVLHEGVSVTFLLRCYYACTSLVAIYCFIYVMDEKRHRWQMLLCYFMAFFSALLIGGIFFTDLIIAGYYAPSHSYAVSVVPGNLYVAFQLYALLSIICFLSVLVFNFKQTQDENEKTDYFYTLLAFSPLVLICFAVVVLMMTGFDASSAMLIPIASTMLLIITLKGKKTALVDISWRSFTPFTLEYKLRRELNLAQVRYIDQSNSHQETMRQIEKALLEYQRDKHDGSIAKASKTIGIMRSTFYSKMHRFDKT